MTYTTIYRGSIYSDAVLADSIYNAAGDAVITDAEFGTIRREIVSTVNEHLPGTLVWIPETSEIQADITEETAFEADDFLELLDSAFWSAFERNGF